MGSPSLLLLACCPCRITSNGGGCGSELGNAPAHRLSPSIVCRSLKGEQDKKSEAIRYRTQPSRALMGSGIEVMVGIPNELLGLILESLDMVPFPLQMQSISKPDFPQDYAFFEGSSHPVVDGTNVYYNAFDGNFDTLVAALNRIGYAQLPIVIGEVGWPTDGAFGANLSAARAFNQGLVNHVLSNKGTPLRPGVPPADCSLIAQPSTMEGCAMPMGQKGNISYAFNSYYQVQKQEERSCDFDGLGMVTFLDPSIGAAFFGYYAVDDDDGWPHRRRRQSDPLATHLLLQLHLIPPLSPATRLLYTSQDQEPSLASSSSRRVTSNLVISLPSAASVTTTTTGHSSPPIRQTLSCLPFS
ncbi:hypothetical protein HPP92_003441 [Vanilla planifolia]|uniref:X8 domain-containing protein n=1 Tax=Vanilla planifolia TaxID=51239 RepID=A0A835S838_VANPL|nr:hypothetical protein HPP92_003441 [Vanilla planifolia]